MDWSTWVQGVSGDLIGAAVDAKYRQPYEIQKLQLQALGDGGYYTEGQAGTRNATAAAGINPMWLLLGGVVLVAMLQD